MGLTVRGLHDFAEKMGIQNPKGAVENLLKQTAIIDKGDGKHWLNP
jgi:hypothetical protein